MSVRILVVGLGSMGRRHLRVIRAEMPDAKIMVLRHMPVTQHIEFADYATSSLDEVREFQPMFAVLASPASLHPQMARELLALGCHLLIEKPLAVSAQAGKQVLVAARSLEQVVQVGYNLRYLPSLQFFRDSIRGGMIGAVLSIRCEVGQSLVSWRENSDYREGVSARREMGGGVLLELSHEIDYLAWIFGRINWVSAWIGKQSNLEIDVEDTAHLLLGFETTQIVPPIASLNLDFIRHDVTRRCVAIGEKGSLAWDAVRGTVEVCLQSEGEWSALHQSSVERDFSYKAQWQSFFGMSRSRKGLKDSPAANLEHAIQVLCVTDAARASSVQQALQVNIPVGAWDAL